MPVSAVSSLLPPQLLSLLQCPVCNSPLTAPACSVCKTGFFSFGGVPSLLPSGEMQKKAWEHQLALMNERAQSGYDMLHKLLERPDLVAATRARAVDSLRASQAANQAIKSLLVNAGLTAQRHTELAQVQLGDISEYYRHILQDWAWDPEIISQRLKPLLTLPPAGQNSAVLALGAGAGRLSWELHKHWSPAVTIATDINPLLLLAGHRLIKDQQPLTLPELNTSGQLAKPLSGTCRMEPAEDSASKRHSWHALAADVWRMPLKPQSVDVIVTSWFVDVHGGDTRHLIPQIHGWLKPGGVWINTGPLLYPEHTPFEYKYGREELAELIRLAGFRLGNEHLGLQRHLASPLKEGVREELVWTFRAEKLAKTEGGEREESPPAWLVYHHLPVPNHFSESQESHPLIDRLFESVDGEKSVSDLCEEVADHVPQGLDLLETVLEILAELQSARRRPKV